MLNLIKLISIDFTALFSCQTSHVKRKTKEYEAEIRLNGSKGKACAHMDDQIMSFGMAAQCIRRLGTTARTTNFFFFKLNNDYQIDNNLYILIWPETRANPTMHNRKATSCGRVGARAHVTLTFVLCV